MDPLSLFYRFGLALVLGGLVGLQRERAQAERGEEFAGVRTFVLFSLSGAGAALLAELLAQPWAFLVLLAVVGALIVVAHGISAARGSVGLTTEMAAILTFVTGALCYWGMVELAAALAVTVTAVLSAKIGLRRFARQLSPADLLAVLKLAAITAIVLPILPNRTFGPPPWDAFNPYRAWLMVIFVSGVGFVGYALMKGLGPGKGIGLSGLLGGLVSSTAVTLSFAHRSRREADLARVLSLGIVASWTVMFGRILVVVAVVNVGLVPRVVLPIIAAGVVGLLYSLVLLRAGRRGESPALRLEVPFELGPAVKFGLLYAGILIAARAGHLYLGDLGVYLSGVVAAVADVDAITLTMAELGRTGGGIEPATAGRAIVVAAMANTAVKGGIVLVLGGRLLRRAIAPAVVAMLLVGTGLAFVI